MRFIFAFFPLAQLLHIVIDVLIAYGLLRYFKQNYMMVVCLIPLGHYLYLYSITGLLMCIKGNPSEV